MLVGLLGFYVSSYLDFAGLQYLSAQFERLILMTYSGLRRAARRCVLWSRLTKGSVASLAISYSGIVFIFCHGSDCKGDNTFLGAALIFGASFTYALYNLWARPLVTRIGAGIFTSFTALAACAGVLLHFMAERSLLDLASSKARRFACSGDGGHIDGSAVLHAQCSAQSGSGAGRVYDRNHKSRFDHHPGHDHP